MTASSGPISAVSVRLTSAQAAKNGRMREDPRTAVDRASPRRLLLLGQVREVTGDHIGAVVAYREVILGGDASAAADARQRLEDLVARWAGRPA